MEIECRDKILALVSADRVAETKLPDSVTKSLREKLIVISAAPDERTLRNLKSLHYEQPQRDRSELKSIRLDDQFRLLLEVDNSRSPPKAILLGVENYR
jgi:proteic killer suppression protein